MPVNDNNCDSDSYVTGVAVAQFYHGGQALGLDADKAMAQVGLDKDHLNPTLHIPVDRYENFILALYEQHGKETMGAEIGQKIMLSLYEPMMSVLMNSQTLDDALQNLSKYFSLSTGNAGGLNYFSKDNNIYLNAVMVHKDLMVRVIVSECVVSLVLGLLRLISTNPNLQFEYVNFQHQHTNDADRRAVEQILSSQVNWSQKEYGICVAKTVLASKIVSYGDAMLKAATELAEQQLKQVSHSLSFEETIKIYIKESMLLSSPRREIVAERLGISARTLDRKLKQHGLGWQELVDDARRTVAMEYLAQQTLSTTDISKKLGFSSVRSFQRRFKTWTGLTVSEYRSSL